MKKLFFLSCMFIALCSHSQIVTHYAATAGIKYPWLEIHDGQWDGYAVDVDQDIREKVNTLYPRCIVGVWHGNSGVSPEPMMIPGDPFGATGYPVAAWGVGTIDRDSFAGAIIKFRPFESYVGIRNATTPNFNVNLFTSYNIAMRTLTIQVTCIALATLSGNWRINAYIKEDSISCSTAASYHQANNYNAPGSISCTGSPSWYIGMGTTITSGFYHMNVMRAILAPGGDIWGEAAFTNPTTGTTVTKTYTYTIPAGWNPNHIKVVGLVQEYGSTIGERLIENAIQGDMVTAYFTHGHTQTMTVCKNSVANPTDAMLEVADANGGHTVSWSLITPAVHGIATAAYSTTAGSSIITPTGTTYTPTAGYTGPDSFRVRFADGAIADTTTIHVNVTAPPAAITGGTLACISVSTAVLGCTPAGGTWSSSNTLIAAVSGGGVVTGIATGTATITYTIAAGCYSTTTVTVGTLPAAGTIIGEPSLCEGQTMGLSSTVSGGKWTTSPTAIATIDSASGVLTAVSAGVVVVSYTTTNNCGSTSATMTFTVNACPNEVKILTGTEADITLHPNPAKENITITSPALIKEVSIFNIVGQLVYRHDYKSDKVTVSLAGLPRGIYVIKVNNGRAFRVIKQ